MIPVSIFWIGVSVTLEIFFLTEDNLVFSQLITLLNVMSCC